MYRSVDAYTYIYLWVYVDMWPHTYMCIIYFLYVWCWGSTSIYICCSDDVFTQTHSFVWVDVCPHTYMCVHVFLYMCGVEGRQPLTHIWSDDVYTQTHSFVWVDVCPHTYTCIHVLVYVWCWGSASTYIHCSDVYHALENIVSFIGFFCKRDPTHMCIMHIL